MKKQPTEKSLYPVVERWLKRQFKCFKTGINTGPKHSRADVVAVRDVGGDLSGEVESIIVEVKRGSEAFATASGQALSYRVYANRVYLADYRPKPFSIDEIHIASHLGVGLIQINGGRCKEVLSSPYYRPITKFNLLLLEKLGLGCCQICNSTFQIGDAKQTWTRLARENLSRALEKQKGLMFWNRELAKRKNDLGLRETQDGSTYERRFICSGCVEQLFSQCEMR